MKKPLPNITANLKPDQHSPVTIGQASKLLGISKDTLRRWEKAGKLTAERTQSGYRVYDLNQIAGLLKSKKTLKQSQPNEQQKDDLLEQPKIQPFIAKEVNFEPDDEFNYLSNSSFYKNLELNNQIVKIEPEDINFEPNHSFSQKLYSLKPIILSRIITFSLILLIISTLTVSGIIASYLFKNEQTRSFFAESGVISSNHPQASLEKTKGLLVNLLSPFNAVVVKMLGSVFPEKSAELGLKMYPPPLEQAIIDAGSSTSPSGEVLAFRRGGSGLLDGQVLAVSSPSAKFLQINLDTVITATASISGSLSSATLNTGFGDNELYPMNQAVLTTSSVNFAGISTGTLGFSTGTNPVTVSGIGVSFPTFTAADTFVLANATQTLTNKSISGSSNTLTNIPNSALTNQKITISVGGLLTGGGAANLGDSVTISLANINLASQVTGILPVANGGTGGSATPTAGGVAYGTGSVYAFSAAGTAGQVLTSGGSGAPTWTNAGAACTNCVLTDPSSTQTISPTGDVTGLSVAQTSTGGPTSDIFNVTNNAGSTKYFKVDSSGNTSTTGTLTASSTLTASNGFTMTTGALNLTSTSGAISATGLSSASISVTSANLALATVTSGNITLTTGASSGLVNVLTGNLKVGAGTPGVTQDGEDAYITGTFEVDGAATLDSTLTVNGTLTANTDVDLVFAGNENMTVTNTTNTLGASGMVDLASTSSTTDTRTLDLSTTFTSTGATTSYGLYNSWTSSAVVTGAGVSQTAYGSYTTAAKTGADDATGTYTLYGTYSTASNTGRTAAGTVNTYGGYFSATGDGAGATTAYGVYTAALGTDTGYGLYIANSTATTDYGVYQADSSDDNYFAGNVGIGSDSTPDTHLEVEAASADVTFQLQRTTDVASTWRWTINGSGQLDLSQVGVGQSMLITSGTGNMVLMANGGNVGVGSDTSPDAKLAVNSSSTSGADFLITNTGVGTSGTVAQITANSYTTGNIFGLSATGLTTGEIADITGTWAPTDGSTNEAIDINITHSPTTLADNFSAINLTTTDGTSLANTVYGINNTVALNNAAGRTGVGIYSTVTSNGATADNLYPFEATTTISGAMTTGTRNVRGIYTHPTSTAASTGGTISMMGLESAPSITGINPGVTDAATVEMYGAYLSSTATAASDCTTNCNISQYGLYVANGTSSTNGTSAKYGVFIVTPTGADTNYSIYSQGGNNYLGGNVGIGDTTPTEANLVIAGSADGTDALYLTAGDILVNNGDLDILGGDFNVTLDSGDGASITSAATATTDAFTTTLTGVGSDAIQINLTQSDDGDATDNSAALRLALTSSSGDADLLYGIDIGNITEGTATEVALRIGSGWTNLMEFEGATDNEFEAYLQITDPTADRTYTLPNASGEICLVAAGNCAGSGTGVTTTGGTSNTLAKFTGSQAIGNSTITDDGTSIGMSIDLDLTFAAAENLSLTNTTASADQLNLSITGVTTSGADGIALAFTQADDGDATDTNAGINLAMDGDSDDADTIIGLNIAALTGDSAAATSYALQIGNTWDQNLYFNDTTTNVAIADGGTITITDGTNTLCSITDAGTTGNLSCSGTIGGTGSVGFWSRTGSTINPSTANDVVSIPTTNTTGADLAITNTGVYTGTGIFNLTANSLTTGTAALITANGISSGNILSLSSTSTAAASNTQTGLNISISGTNGTAGQTTYGAQVSNTHEGATSTNIAASLTATGGTTANTGLNIASIGTASGSNRSILLGTLTGGTTLNYHIMAGSITAIDGAANYYLSLGHITGGGATATNAIIDAGNISATGANNFGIRLGTLTGGSTANYQFTTGTLTSIASSTSYQVNLGTTVGAASATFGGINIGAISGAGTQSAGIIIGANSSTATTNYGINVGAISGAGTTNYGLFVGAVSGASTNISLAFAKENAHTIQIADSTTADTVGGALTIKGAAGAATNAAGGAINITGGTGAGSGNGGALVLTGGVNAGSGNGGAVSVTAGSASTGTGDGGLLTLAGGAGGSGAGTHDGGGINITTGNSGSNGTAGGINMNVGTSAGAGNGSINIGTAARNQTINLGNTSNTKTITLDTGVTTGTTTTSALALNANALTSGTGLFATSTSITSGKLLDLTTGTANTWTGNGTTNGFINIASSSTAGTGSASSILLNLSRSGTNANNAHTAYGIYSSVTNENGTSGTNVAGYFSASGATTANYGLYVAAGNVFSAGVFLGPSGATGAPAYSFSGDPNTGIWQDSGDTIKVSTGGTARFYLSDSSIRFFTASTGDVQISNSSTLTFSSNDSAGDTNLYRSAANTLKTDDSFIAAATSGNAFGGAGLTNVILRVTGSLSNSYGVYMDPTLTPDDGTSGYGVMMTPTITAAVGRTIPSGFTLDVEPPGKGGTGTITNFASLNIAGAPIDGVNNFALRITAGSQPTAVLGATGTNAGTTISAVSATGGNTTIATTGTGGVGGAFSFTGGTGGTAASANTASTGGAGGAYTVLGGTGGAAAATGTNVGGAGGALSLTAGTGGAASGGTGNTGGAGGAITLLAGSAGSGGNANGGTLTLNSGAVTGSGTSTINLGTSNTTIFEIGDSTVTKTIDIGGVTSSAADTINIATNGTAADTLAIGNTNASTTFALTGGNDWSITAAGAATFASTLTASNGFTMTTGALSLTATSGSASITGGSGDIVSVTSTSTGSNDKALNISQTGATSGTDYAGYFSNTGNSTTNIGLYSTASGGTNNYAAIFEAGNVGIGLTSPTARLNTKNNGTGATTYSFLAENGDGTDMLLVRDDGAVSAYIRTTAETTALCHNGTTGFAEITDCNGSATDLAENYGTTDSSIEAGDLVIADGEAQVVADPNQGKPTTKANVLKTTYAYQELIGVVSTNPNQVYGDDIFSPSENPRPISLVGRVPVKVSTENGLIEVGDYITSSSTPGVGMKSTKPGPVIGKALNSYNGAGVGKIVVFVKPTFADPSNVLANLTLDSDGSLIIGSLANKIQITSNVNIVGAIKANSISIDSSTLNLTGSLASVPVSNNKVSLADAINVLGAKADSLQSTVNSLQSEQASSSAQLAQTQSTISSHAAEIASAAAELAKSKDSIASLQSDVNNLKLTPPEILIATESASFVSVNVTNKVSTLALESLDATISGTFKALGDNFLGKTTIAGDLTVDGTFSITGGNSINSLGTLFVQNSPLASLVDLFNGKVAINKDGLVSLEKLAVSSDTLGTATIPFGQTEVEVTSAQLTDKSRVFATANKSVAVGVKSKDVNNQKFVLEIPSVLSSDTLIDWWIVDQR